MKFIAGTALMLIFSMLGIAKGNKLTASVRNTERLILFFKEMKNRISYSSDSVCEIIFNSKNSSPLVNECKRMLYDDDFPVVWEKSVNKVKNLFTEEEKDILFELGEDLGSTDKQGQIRIIDYAVLRLENTLSEKKEKEKSEKKLCCFTGISLGIIAMIIII